ncbi:discoidin domain-containing protein [Dysgonomonas sp. BGC7]|uniref:discoidin domain-containing protein n=1 Tax=Dysgonomonas sp. BGC7 TaxID=1658008 RepID=UPI000680FDD6|nr:discoidin domain-containing protein [Dysgonomonas sp. BGC7]MBD8390476.1 discoidin domain-containing protein [Dysgonomonas sp. BGC7]
MIKKIIFMMLASLMLSGCSDDKGTLFEEDYLFLSIRPKEMFFNSKKSSQKVVIVTNAGEFTVDGVVADTWCTYKIENNVIEITVSSFDEPAGTRTTNLTISKGDKRKEVTITQTGPQETDIDRINDWKVIFATTWVSGDDPYQILDGNTTSIWHTGYSDSHEGDKDLMSKMPQWVLIDMGYTTELDSVAICRRTDAANWDAREVSVWVGNDPSATISNEGMTKIAQISLPHTQPEKESVTGLYLNSFGSKVTTKVRGRYIKYVVEESRRNVAQVAEVYAFGKAFK